MNAKVWLTVFVSAMVLAVPGSVLNSRGTLSFLGSRENTVTGIFGMAMPSAIKDGMFD
jgi:hypothetical protein